jgi:drug/metabolite transporter (DMT)-like permease
MNNITIRRFRQINSTALTTIMMGVGALVTLPFSIAFEGLPPLPSLQTAFAILGLGVISTALMNHLRVLVVRSAGPSFMTLVNYQVPVWAIVLGSIFLGETLPSALLISLILILGGVAISQWGSLRRLFIRTQG